MNMNNVNESGTPTPGLALSPVCPISKSYSSALFLFHLF